MSTYKAVAEFAQTWGLGLFRRHLRQLCWSTRCGRRNEARFEEAARIPLRED